VSSQFNIFKFSGNNYRDIYGNTSKLFEGLPEVWIALMYKRCTL